MFQIQGWSESKEGKEWSKIQSVDTLIYQIKRNIMQDIEPGLVGARSTLIVFSETINVDENTQKPQGLKKKISQRWSIENYSSWSLVPKPENTQYL